MSMDKIKGYLEANLDDGTLGMIEKHLHPGWMKVFTGKYYLVSVDNILEIFYSHNMFNEFSLTWKYNPPSIDFHQSWIKRFIEDNRFLYIKFVQPRCKWECSTFDYAEHFNRSAMTRWFILNQFYPKGYTIGQPSTMNYQIPKWKKRTK